MTTDHVRVDHHSLAFLAEQMVETVRQMDARLDHLAAQLAPTRQTWSGRASDAFTHAQTTWDRELGEMSLLLRAARDRVVRADESYRAADRRGAAEFGG